jgi:TonB-linked SusC/RagA family outer membrane protein
MTGWMRQPLLAQGEAATSIQGKIVEADTKQPLSGVTVQVVGSRLGAVTDKQGQYKIVVRSAGRYELEARSVGFEPAKKLVSVEAGQTATVDFELGVKFSLQKDVVVVGYGQQDRKTLASALTSIDAAEVKNIPVAGVDQMMQGRAAGVQVVSNSGTPGAGLNVRVRGTTSITASNEPLYVIDGIPVVSRSLGQVGVGGQTANPMADINPADIESIEVLKDASATAIYGARAANGVVLITTKRGAVAKGEPRATIEFNAFYGLQSAWKNPLDNLVDARTFQALSNEAVRNGNPNAALPFPNPDQVAVETLWPTLIFQNNAPISNVDVSVQGGVGNLRYFVSGNSFAQEGITKRNTFYRKSGRANLDFGATERLNVGISVLYARTDRERTGNDNNINGAIGAAFFNPPNIPVRQPDGSFTKFSIFENPQAVVEHQDLRMKVNRVLASVYADYNILDGLIFKSTFSVDYNNVKEDQYLPTQLNAGAGVNGQAFSSVVTDNNWIWENVLTYQTRIEDNHKLNILLGNTNQNNYRERTSATGEQFPSNDFRRIASAAVQRSFSDGTGWGIVSFFARASYSFSDLIFVDANIRADGSSRFGSANRWGIFPSFGAGFNVMELEGVKASVPAISVLKLRGSWGQTGNQEIPNFAAPGLWTGGRNYADLPGTQPFQLANPNLRWETTTQTDIGFDLGLLDNRISITFDWYRKYTDGLLLNVELPRTTGFSSQTQNFGEMSNTGIELGINALLVKNESITWTANFNIARNRAVIERMATPITAFTRDLIRLETGAPMYAFWLHDQVGVDVQTGEAIWRTVNGTGRLSDGSFNPNRDRFIVGDAQPSWFGGLTTNVSAFGFDLMMFWQFSLGNKQLHWNRFFQEHGGTRNTQFSTSQLPRWRNPGDVTMIPRMTAANYRGDLRPSRFLEDGSFIRLKNVSLGYTLPAGLLSGAGVTSLRVYVGAQNLLTFTRYTGLDPELNSGADDGFALVQGIELYAMPQPRTITFGINLTF